ncbi:MAG: hypothetical protein JO031_01710, partial [Ktedonobacteraceae bacterium]|nr:hypothetical protein [Ktedonobacteraceae bacterium]
MPSSSEEGVESVNSTSSTSDQPKREKLAASRRTISAGQSVATQAREKKKTADTVTSLIDDGEPTLRLKALKTRPAKTREKKKATGAATSLIDDGEPT